MAVHCSLSFEYLHFLAFNPVVVTMILAPVTRRRFQWRFDAPAEHWSMDIPAVPILFPVVRHFIRHPNLPSTNDV
jgi:hypothetical protein